MSRSLRRGAPPRNPANAGQGGQITNISTRTQMREREVKNKGNSELNEHALVTQKCFHQTPFQTRLRVPPPLPNSPTPPQMRHHSTSESDRVERKSLFRLKWVSSEIMNMSLRKTKSPTKRATLLQRQRRWQIIVFKSGTAL